MTFIETALIVYLSVGLLYSLTGLWLLRAAPGSFWAVLRDCINFTLFYPYLMQLQWARFKLEAKRASELTKYKAQFEQNPEAFKQDTVNALKKLMDELDKHTKTGTKN